MKNEQKPNVTNSHCSQYSARNSTPNIVSGSLFVEACSREVLYDPIKGY